MSKQEFASPLLFERYELKFLIPLEMVEDISNFVDVYCELDPYSAREKDNFYKVNNIYLDTPDYLFLRRRLAGIDHRFNMRIRSYGDSPVFPYFCEVKHKTMGIVKKKRAKIYEENWAETFKEKHIVNKNDKCIWSDQEDYKDHFLRLAYTHNASPKIFTQYRRKAYASVVDEYARVTFDRDLRFQRRETYNLHPTEGKLSHYDNPSKFDLDNNIILELKCTTHVPKWFLDLMSYFNLTRTSFSKYVTGITEVIEDNHFYHPDRIMNDRTFAQSLHL
jgi:hypothetical protein